jgi:hypothetical protein
MLSRREGPALNRTLAGKAFLTLQEQLAAFAATLAALGTDIFCHVLLP